MFKFMTCAHRVYTSLRIDGYLLSVHTRCPLLVACNHQNCTVYISFIPLVVCRILRLSLNIVVHALPLPFGLSLMQIAAALPDDLQNVVTTCMAAWSAPLTYIVKKTVCMLRRIAAVDPPVLPMYTRERFVRAIKVVIMEGGKGGGQRCENAIYDFVRAVQLWHGIAGTEAVDDNLQSSWARQMLKGLKKLAPASFPKNLRYIEGAEHGHLPLPYDYFMRFIQYADSLLDPYAPFDRIGLHRTAVISLFLMPLARRFDEVQQATFDSLVDLGPPNGLNFTIKHMKNSQRKTTVIPIPEVTEGGLDIGRRIRNFLAIAPKKGRLFRGTINRVGAAGHDWEPAEHPTMVFDPDGTVRWGLTEAVYYSGEWNEAFQALLAKAVPEANVRLYTAHSLRDREGGGDHGRGPGRTVCPTTSYLCCPSVSRYY